MLDAFLARTDMDQAGGCWAWGGPLNKAGYGVFYAGGYRTVGAHRWIWEVVNGVEAPRGMFVCHTCDNPCCVNPAHLVLGSPKFNTQDMMRKGRRVAPVVLNRRRGDQHHSRRTPECLRRGELHPSAKLSDADVRYIRTSPENGAALSRRFGVSKVTVSRIRRRIIWKSVA